MYLNGLGSRLRAEHGRLSSRKTVAVHGQIGEERGGKVGWDTQAGMPGGAWAERDVTCVAPQFERDGRHHSPLPYSLPARLTG